ncbi:hypothetical protein [Streptomyces eurythermus]
MTGWTRRHCTCVEVRNLTYDEAAAALRVKRRWLEDNIRCLPHMKFGGQPAVFCHCDLRLIQAMRTVLPPEAQRVLDAPTTDDQHALTEMPTIRSLASIKPAQGRRRATAVT